MEELRIEDIERWCRIAALFKEEYEKHRGLLSASELGVHLSFETFTSLFKDFDVIDRDDEKYDYEICVSLKGIKIFAICTKEELEGIK